MPFGTCAIFSSIHRESLLPPSPAARLCLHLCEPLPSFLRSRRRVEAALGSLAPCDTAPIPRSTCDRSTVDRVVEGHYRPGSSACTARRFRCPHVQTPRAPLGTTHTPLSTQALWRSRLQSTPRQATGPKLTESGGADLTGPTHRAGMVVMCNSIWALGASWCVRSAATPLGEVFHGASRRPSPRVSAWLPAPALPPSGPAHI